MKAALRLWGTGLVAILCGCGIQRVAQDTQSAVQNGNNLQSQLVELSGKLLGNMEATKKGIHLQTLSTSLQGMLKPENTEILSPPSRMIPFAKTFGDEATTTELIEMLQAFFGEVL